MRGAGLEKPEVYSLEYNTNTIHGVFFRAEHDADGRGSYAAVERSMSDRLLSTTDLKSSLVQFFAAHSHYGLHPSPVSGS